MMTSRTECEEAKGTKEEEEEETGRVDEGGGSEMQDCHSVRTRHFETVQDEQDDGED
jgi:hypothetical protein